MASEASKALEALERDVGAVGVETAALRLAARLAGVEADGIRASLDGSGELNTLDVPAVAKRLSDLLGVEAGEAVELLGVQGSRPGAGTAETVLARCYAVALLIARAGVIIGTAPAVEWARSDHTWLGGAPLEVLTWPAGEQRVFGLLDSLEDGNYL